MDTLSTFFPFFACRQIFLLFFGLCLMVFRIGPRPSWEHNSILGVLGHYSLPRLVMSCYIFPKSLLLVPSQVCPSDIRLLSLLTLSLDYSLMRYGFFSLIEGAQACPTPCLRACVSKATAPLRMVTGVVPVTTPPTLKLEQWNIIYQDKRWQ